MPRLSTDEKENLSANLKKLSEKVHLSVPQMAKLCDIPLRTFESYFYSKNSKSPSENNLKKIAKAFNTTPTALISSDYHLTTIEENRIYHSVCYIRDELLDNEPATIIRDFICQKYPEHYAFINFCKSFDLHVNYVPVFSIEEVENLTMDDISGIDILELEKYMKTNQLKGLRNLESEKHIKENLLKKGDTEEEALKKIASYRKAAQKMADIIQPDIPESIRKKYGLQYIADGITQGRYQRIEPTELPIRIEICRTSSSPDPQKTNINDYIVPVKTYSIAEFIDIQNKFCNELYKELS